MILTVLDIPLWFSLVLSESVLCPISLAQPITGAAPYSRLPLTEQRVKSCNIHCCLTINYVTFQVTPISYIDMTAESMKLSSLNTERNRIDSMVRYYENLKSLDSSFSENLDSLILEEKKTLIRVIKEIDLKQFKIEEKQKRYEKPLVSILFLLQIFGFYILILYSSYFDRTNKVNRVIAVENIPDRKKVRSYFCDKVLKPLVLLLSVFLWGFLFFLWLR